MTCQRLMKSELKLPKTSLSFQLNIKILTNAPVYPVELSQKLQNLIETTKGQLTKNEINNRTL